jgi:NADH:ubiquinone oxidoreductase subunit H
VIAVEIAWGWILAIKTAVVLAIIPFGALLLGYVFLLKMMSHMQSRLGPMDPGGFHGWFQLIGDGIKFLQKEDVRPAQADKRVFAMAPAIILISTFLIYIVVPAGPRLVVRDLDVGIFFALAVSSLSVIGVLMAGWASANKYALLGALRAAGQLIAYELPLVLAVVGVVIQAGTMSLQGIVFAQQDGEIFGWGGIGNPFILTQFVGFILFLIAAQAELTQTPFDMPVAESELVGGYYVEYTGLPLPLLLHGGVRDGLRLLRSGRHDVPRGVVAPVGPRDERRRARARGVAGQGDAGRLPHLLDALHVPAPAGGPAAVVGLEDPDPARPGEHHGDGHPQGRRVRTQRWR